MNSTTVEPVSPPPAHPRAVSEPAASSPLARGHIPALDGIRGIAILLVMLCHFYHGPGRSSNFFERQLSTIARAGWCGVDLFFVLSGFLITGILWDSRHGRHYFRSFYARRTLRIFPPYYGFLLLVAIITWFLAARVPQELALFRDHQAWYWLYLTNALVAVKGSSEIIPRWASPLWSLSVEEQFYLVWPLVVLWFNRITLMRICAASLIVCLLLRIGLHRAGVPLSTIYCFTPARLDVLLIGAFIALYVRGRITLRRDIFIALAAMCAGTIFLLYGAARWGMRNTDPRIQAYGFAAFALLFGGLIFLTVVAPPSSRLVLLLSNRSLRWIGKYSYGIYIFHMPLERALSVLPHGKTNVLVRTSLSVPRACAHVAIVSAAAMLLAYASYHLYEKHFLRLKRFVPYE